MPELTYLDGLRQALHEEMAMDPAVVVLGEDVGRMGGAFGVTAGLLDAFGPSRVIDTPLAESAIVGAAAGAAVGGLKPVAELQFIDFISCGGFDPLVNVAAKSRYRTGVGCPMVLRGPAGAGTRGGPFHSASPEMWAVSTPGIKVVCPSTPADACGLLKSAIRDPDPVLFLEYKALYRRLRGPVSADAAPIPLGCAAVRRQGRDVALITYGAMTETCLAAADAAAKDGIDVHVLDLRTLVPLDEAAVLATVRDIGKIIVVHEHPGRGGFAGELCAVIQTRAFEYLDAPIRRVTAPNTPVPHAPVLEDAYLPQVKDVMAIVREVVAY